MFVTIEDFLKASPWVCQWRCPYLGEVNQIRQRDLPSGITSLDDLLRHLICQSCGMSLKEIPLMQIITHETHPAAIPQKKKFSIHFWPEAPEQSSTLHSFNISAQQLYPRLPPSS
jgi:hypothetical protein